MYANHTQKYIFYSILVLIFAIAWLIQSSLLMNVDVSWLLEASKRMLAGGNYTNDYFENNPPWILYFNIPPILLSKFLLLKIAYSLRVYIFFLTIVSLILSYHLLQRIFINEDAYIIRFLMIVLAILFLIIPVSNFGQREHLLFVLTMPYFLLMTLRIKEHRINTYLALGVGYLAGLAFLLKPYFFIPLLLNESYYLLKKKRILACLRTELITILSLLLIYTLLIFIRHNDYLHLITPFALRWCYFGTKQPWSMMFNNLQSLFCCLPILFCIATHENNHYKDFTIIMALALIGYFLSFLIQRVCWFYHLLPAFCMASFIYLFVFCIFVNSVNKIKYTYILSALFGLILLMTLSKVLPTLNYYFIFRPVVYFCLVTIVFSMILYLNPCNLCRTLFDNICILLLSILISLLCHLAIKKSVYWQNLAFVMIYFIQIISFSLLVPGKFRYKARYAFITILCFLILFLPYYNTLSRLIYTHKNDKAYQKLTAFLDNHASNQAVYFFTTNISDAFPVIPNSQSISGSRFSFFWSLPGLVKQSFLPMDFKHHAQLLKDKNFLIDMIVDDIENNKPKLVFIDSLNHKNSMLNIDNVQDKLVINYISFNYLDYFSNNKRFSDTWKNFHYLNTISWSSRLHINPFAYSIKLTYLHPPQSKDIKSDILYLYLRNNDVVEVALRDDYKLINKIVMKANDGELNQEQLNSIKRRLIKGKGHLSNTNRRAVFLWLSRQYFVYPLYKFQVYERNINLT